MPILRQRWRRGRRVHWRGRGRRRLCDCIHHACTWMERRQGGGPKKMHSARLLLCTHCRNSVTLSDHPRNWSTSSHERIISLGYTRSGISSKKEGPACAMTRMDARRRSWCTRGHTWALRTLSGIIPSSHVEGRFPAPRKKSDAARAITASWRSVPALASTHDRPRTGEPHANHGNGRGGRA